MLFTDNDMVSAEIWRNRVRSHRGGTRQKATRQALVRLKSSQQITPSLIIAQKIEMANDNIAMISNELTSLKHKNSQLENMLTIIEYNCSTEKDPTVLLSQFDILSQKLNLILDEYNQIDMDDTLRLYSETSTVPLSKETLETLEKLKMELSTHIHDVTTELGKLENKLGNIPATKIAMQNQINQKMYDAVTDIVNFIPASVQNGKKYDDLIKLQLSLSQALREFNGKKILDQKELDDLSKGWTRLLEVTFLYNEINQHKISQSEDNGKMLATVSNTLLTEMNSNIIKARNSQDIQMMKNHVLKLSNLENSDSLSDSSSSTALYSILAAGFIRRVLTFMSSDYNDNEDWSSLSSMWKDSIPTDKEILMDTIVLVNRYILYNTKEHATRLTTIYTETIQELEKLPTMNEYKHLHSAKTMLQTQIDYLQKTYSDDDDDSVVFKSWPAYMNFDFDKSSENVKQIIEAVKNNDNIIPPLQLIFETNYEYIVDVFNYWAFVGSIVGVKDTTIQSILNGYTTLNKITTYTEEAKVSLHDGVYAVIHHARTAEFDRIGALCEHIEAWLDKNQPIIKWATINSEFYDRFDLDYDRYTDQFETSNIVNLTTKLYKDEAFKRDFSKLNDWLTIFNDENKTIIQNDVIVPITESYRSTLIQTRIDNIAKMRKDFESFMLINSEEKALVDKLELFSISLDQLPSYSHVKQKFEEIHTLLKRKQQEKEGGDGGDGGEGGVEDSCPGDGTPLDVTTSYIRLFFPGGQANGMPPIELILDKWDMWDAAGNLLVPNLFSTLCVRPNVADTAPCILTNPDGTIHANSLGQPHRMFDNSFGGMYFISWSGNNRVLTFGDEWIGFAFGAPVTMASMRLTFRSRVNTYWGVAKLQTSADGTTWAHEMDLNINSELDVFWPPCVIPSSPPLVAQKASLFYRVFMPRHATPAYGSIRVNEWRLFDENDVEILFNSDPPIEDCGGPLPFCGVPHVVDHDCIDTQPYSTGTDCVFTRNYRMLHTGAAMFKGDGTYNNDFWDGSRRGEHPKFSVWAAVALASAKTVSRIELLIGMRHYVPRGPTYFQQSDDGSNWETIGAIPFVQYEEYPEDGIYRGVAKDNSINQVLVWPAQ